MLQYPNIDPIALQVGVIKIHWYGLMYLLGFFTSFLLICVRAKKPNSGWTVDQLSDLLFYVALGVIVGGRTGNMLFYDFPTLIQDPLSYFKIWQGGMAFHGGLLGVMLAVWLYARKYHRHFADITDYIAPLFPIGLGLGRLGNFINGELFGTITTVPWGMVFPHGGPFIRHPSQLYEFFLEGVFMFTVLWWFSARPRPRYAVSGLFLVLYSICRILVEFVREPDPQYGYLAFDWLTMGQLLCLPMLVLGIIIIGYAYHKPVYATFNAGETIK